MFSSGATELTIPTSSQLFRLNGPEEALQRALVVGAPSAPEDTPPSLFFERKRDVEIPWKTIFSGIATPLDESVDALRIDLERSVGLDETPLDLLKQSDVDRVRARYLALGPQPPETEGAKPAIVTAYRSKFAFTEGKRAEGATAPVKAAITTSAEEIRAGIAFKHGSGRVYLITPTAGAALEVDDFGDLGRYAEAWSKKIAGIELVYLSAAEATDYTSGFEEIDLSAQVIEAKMRELLELRDFQDKLLARADGAIDAMLSSATQGDLDLDEIERIQNKALQMKMAGYQIAQRVKRLIGQASALGYLLFDAKQSAYKLPDGKVVAIEAGNLYRKFQRIAKWTTTETVSRTVRQVLRVLFVEVATNKTVEEKVQRQHSCIIDDYEQVDTSKDLLEEKVLELRHRDLDVHVFRETAQGYLSAEDVSLEAVMDECGRDENTRRRCVVILPIYERAVTGQRALVKYHVFTRPLPGVQPVAMPRLTVVESLSYRIAWTGVQLGQLVSALNLAPGESRTISLRREYERETTVSESRSSVFDLDRQESSDLSDEMESQLRHESEQSEETSMSLEVKGSYGFVSAAANASHGSKNSLRNFSQGINKLAKKSSQSINSRQRDEVTSTSTSRTKVSTFDETTARIENINQGRTLNLMFYRLYNRLRSGLYVEGLKFQVLSSTEMIAGSGVLRSRTHTFDTFADLIDQFRDTALPVRIAERDKFRYLRSVLATLETLLTAEYQRVTLTARASDEQKRRAARSVSVLTLGATADAESVVDDEHFEPEAARRARELKEQNDKTQEDIARLRAEAEETQAQYDAYVKARARMTSRLKAATLESNSPLEGTTQELLVAAPGLYLDAALGVQPGTEPYSEAMRQQRVRHEAADVAVKIADARYKLALAGRLRGRSGGPGENWITGVMPDPESGTLTLRFKLPLEDADWQLHIDGVRVEIAGFDRSGKYTVSMKLADSSILDRDDFTASLIELRDEADGRLVSSTL